MAHLLLTDNVTDIPPLPNGNCTDGVQWILAAFGQCLISTVEIVGFYLGLFSILCWFLVYLPQLYENYKRGRCDDALSIWFLLFWLAGDTCNLIGCFLTHQFPIQTMTAIYYVAMDLSIIIQYMYYDIKRRKAASGGETQGLLSGSDTTESYSSNNNNNGSLLPAVAVATGLGGGAGIARGFTFGGGGADKAQLAGYIIGLLSTVFYLGSRLPQIIMNFKRGKTEGVSYLTFLLAVIANFAYAFSVLMGPRDENQTYIDFVLDHLPWLTGSLGTVFLDFTILLQCLCLKTYNEVNYDDEEEDGEEEPLLQA